MRRPLAQSAAAKSLWMGNQIWSLIEVLERAALLSGILCRLQGYEKDGKLRALQDCVLFLQAQRLGLVVLTANGSDYDILLQLIPTGRVLFYRCK